MRIRSANTKCNSARVSVLALVKCLVFVTCAFSACTLSAAQGASNPERFFQEGEAALRDGKLTQAEVAFRRVVAVDPRSAGAFSNLGVIAMRQRSWARAIENLEMSRPCRSILGEQALDTKPAIFQKTEHLMARPAFGWRGKTFPARIELEQLAICLDNDVAIFEWKQGSGRLQLTRVEGGEAGGTGSSRMSDPPGYGLKDRQGGARRDDLRQSAGHGSPATSLIRCGDSLLFSARLRRARSFSGVEL